MSKSEETLLGSKLPSRGQVLRVFLHHHMNLNEDVKTSATAVWEEIRTFWEKARIPTIRKDHGNDKILALFTAWQSLKKNMKRKCTNQISKENAFSASLEDLFDVASADALLSVKNEIDNS